MPSMSTSQLLLIFLRPTGLAGLYSTLVAAVALQASSSSPSLESTTPSTTSAQPTTSSTPSPCNKRCSTAAIVGAIVATIIVLSVLFFAYVWKHRRASLIETNAWTGPDPFKPTCIFKQQPSIKSISKRKATQPFHSAKQIQEFPLSVVNEQHAQLSSRPKRSCSAIEKKERLRQNFRTRQDIQANTKSYASPADPRRNSTGRRSGKKNKQTTATSSRQRSASATSRNYGPQSQQTHGSTSNEANINKCDNNVAFLADWPEEPAENTMDGEGDGETLAGPQVGESTKAAPAVIDTVSPVASKANQHKGSMIIDTRSLIIPTPNLEHASSIVSDNPPEVREHRVI